MYNKSIMTLPSDWLHLQTQHHSHRAGWLRAAILGADDGIVSTTSLMIGVAAAQTSKQAILTAGIAGMIAGALSMAAGEYVSVSSQLDAERADLSLEAQELKEFANEEMQELEHIYVQRGLEPQLAQEVVKQLHAHDALAAHARDELNIDHTTLAKPLQAAISSAVSFGAGALLPILVALISSSATGPWFIAGAALLLLVILGIVGASIGGGSRWIAALRVLVGGGLAMAITAIIGRLVGVAI